MQTFYDVRQVFLDRLNSTLLEGFEAKLSENNRIYYLNHINQTSSWLPPAENWKPGVNRLPYGWEVAVDNHHKAYFINHVEKFATKDDPRKFPDYIEHPEPREVELFRDPQKGFGFVAGSEKPVVVRFVTDGGPSVDKLLPGDQIIKINNRDVKTSPREYVIDLVRSCKDSIQLTVCQPYISATNRKSAMLTATKRAKLKTNPSRVRFSDSVIINGAASLVSQTIQESYLPLMPNVLKVFLENGQTKSFKYDNKTTVKDVLLSLQEKLNIIKIEHFALVLQNTKMLSHGKMMLLQESDTIFQIASRPGATHFRCLFRVAFVPRDAYELLNDDRVAFEYFYMQCCNDVVNERFTAELKYDTALRLGALHVQQHFSNNNSGKISVKNIQRECGLDKFVPKSLIDNMKAKDMRKLMRQYLKLNQSLSAPGQKCLTALQAKLHYLKIVSEIKTFGSRVFMVTLLDKKTEAMVLVGPRYGIGLVTNIKSYTVMCLVDFDQIHSMSLSNDSDSMQKVDIFTTDPQDTPISLGLLNEDMGNFLSMVEGYYRLFVDPDAILTRTSDMKVEGNIDAVPKYLSVHKVIAAPWSYADLNGAAPQDNERLIDLSSGPPAYETNPLFSEKITVEMTRRTSGDSFIAVEGETPRPRVLFEYEEAVTSFSEFDDGEVDEDKDDNAEVSNVMSSLNVPDDECLSFRRYIPSPIISHAKRITDRSRSSSLNADSDIDFSLDPSFSKITDDNEYDDAFITVLERQEDVDEGGNENCEDDTKNVSPSDLNKSLNDQCPIPEKLLDQSGSDTDSMCDTPITSPYHTRSSPITTPLSAPRSSKAEGLKFPASELDYYDLASSFGLHSPDQIPTEIYEAMYHPKCLDDSGLCVDQEIIDLTLLPPPSTPDNELEVALSISEQTGPPPVKFSNSHSSIEIISESLTETEYENDSGNETISSEIVDLPQEYTLVPDSSSSGVCCLWLNDQQLHRGHCNNGDCCEEGVRNICLDDENIFVHDDFSSLIIPPPPVTDISHDISLSTHSPLDNISCDTFHSSLNLYNDIFAISNDLLDCNVIQNIGDTSNVCTENDSPNTVSKKLSDLLDTLPVLESNAAVENYRCSSSPQCLTEMTDATTLKHKSELRVKLQATPATFDHRRNHLLMETTLDNKNNNLSNCFFDESHADDESFMNNCKSHDSKDRERKMCYENVEFRELKHKLQHYHEALVSKRNDLLSQGILDPGSSDKSPDRTPSRPLPFNHHIDTSPVYRTHKVLQLKSTPTVPNNSADGHLEGTALSPEQLLAPMKPMFSTLPIKFHGDSVVRPVFVNKIPEKITIDETNQRGENVTISRSLDDSYLIFGYESHLHHSLQSSTLRRTQSDHTVNRHRWQDARATTNSVAEHQTIGSMCCNVTSQLPLAFDHPHLQLHNGRDKTDTNSEMGQRLDHIHFDNKNSVNCYIRDLDLNAGVNCTSKHGKISYDCETGLSQCLNDLNILEKKLDEILLSSPRSSLDKNCKKFSCQKERSLSSTRRFAVSVRNLVKNVAKSETNFNNFRDLETSVSSLTDVCVQCASTLHITGSETHSRKVVKHLHKVIGEFRNIVNVLRCRKFYSKRSYLESLTTLTSNIAQELRDLLAAVKHLTDVEV